MWPPCRQESGVTNHGQLGSFPTWVVTEFIRFPSSILQVDRSGDAWGPDLARHYAGDVHTPAITLVMMH